MDENRRISRSTGGCRDGKSGCLCRSAVGVGLSFTEKMRAFFADEAGSGSGITRFIGSV